MKIRKSLFFLLILLIAVVAFSFIFFKQKTDAQYSGGSGGGSASASGTVFGGKVSNTKAKDLEIKETEYNCTVPGQTIEITPLKGTKYPTGYIIQSGVRNTTGYSKRIGQWIIGKYTGTTTINCTLKVEPFTPSTVTLSTITLYGTSKI